MTREMKQRGKSKGCIRAGAVARGKGVVVDEQAHGGAGWSGEIRRVQVLWHVRGARVEATA
jgi:hypothetical protein